jgi:drug/metabolite transporter (DMT)-like permease
MTHRDRLELVLLAAIWGASFLFMRIAVPEFGPFALVELRVAIAALFLVAVLLWQGGARALIRRMLPLTVVGLFGSALPFVLFAYGTLTISAGTAAVVNATAPLFAALVGCLAARQASCRAKRRPCRRIWWRAAAVVGQISAERRGSRAGNGWFPAPLNWDIPDLAH